MNEPWAIIVGGGIVLGAWLGPIGLVVGIWLVLIMHVVRGAFGPWPTVVLAFAVLIGMGRMELTPEHTTPPEFAESTGATGTVTSMLQHGASSSTFTMRVDELIVGDALTSAGSALIQVRVQSDVEVSRGDEIRVQWEPELLEGVLPSYADYLRSGGFVGTAWANRVVVTSEGSAAIHVIQGARDRIDHGFQQLMPFNVAALASGIVTGNDSGLPVDLADAFRDTGTSHVTAVSGSNIAMVLAIWNLFLPGRRGRRMLAIQMGIVASIWVYAFMTGLEPPATRAAAMGMIMVFGGRFGRRADPMSLLALSGGLMVLWNPQSVELVSFWLSMAASAAIISRAPISPTDEWSEVAKGTVQGTILAQIATLPIVLLTFGQWSMVGILANLVVAPVMALAFPLCFLTALLILIVPGLAPLVAWIPDIVLRVVIALVEGFAEVMPPVRIDDGGLARALAITVPCLLGLLLMGKDGQRWLRKLERAARERRDQVAVVVWAPCVGVVFAGLIRSILG